MPRRAKAARVLASLAAGIAVLLALAASGAEVILYKWTDKDGKVQYGDKPPAKFDGAVERLSIDPAANTTMQLPSQRTDVTPSPRPPASDIAAKRKSARERLQANLDRARAKLELARAELAVAGGPDDNERQVMQQRYPRQEAGTASARGNCRPVEQGKSAVMCPTLVPGEAYYERISKLESAVREAEAEVAAAEDAYRRGVD